MSICNHFCDANNVNGYFSMRAVYYKYKNTVFTTMPRPNYDINKYESAYCMYKFLIFITSTFIINETPCTCYFLANKA